LVEHSPGNLHYSVIQSGILI